MPVDADDNQIGTACLRTALLRWAFVFMAERTFAR